MATVRFSNDLIKSLRALRPHLIEGPSEAIVQAAVHANPWFTPYYITTSLRAIAQWFEEASLLRLQSKLPTPYPTPKRIGIIAAGNLPLVGFHDLLMAVISGNIAFVKPSHQDEILMKWVINKWLSVDPKLTPYLHVVDQLPELEVVVATGSDNSARYFKARYGHLTHLIRGSRSSVALLSPDASDADLHQLSEDIFLYNGLGCRNVSSVIALPGFDMHRWVEILSAYPERTINPYYLKKVARERARLILQHADFIDTPFVLIKPVNSFGFGHMGILNLLSVETDAEAHQLISEYSSKIQCAVGVDTTWGCTQYPDLFTFADQVNTLSMFLEGGGSGSPEDTNRLTKF